MDLELLYTTIEQYAMNTKTVESVTYLSPYVVWNSLNMKYPAFSAELEYVRYDENVIEYHYIFSYGTKLANDSSNLFEGQNTGFNVIRNVINHLIDDFGLDSLESTEIHPFAQRFSDQLCGAYASVVIYLPMDDLDCEGFDKEQ